MLRKMGFVVVMAAIGVTSAAYALPKASAGDITVTVEGMEAGNPIPVAQALCTPTADGKSEKVEKPLRPTIRWSGVPKEAASLAIFMMDPDVPADFSDAGKEGKTLAKNAKRQDFFHYALVDVPTSATSLPGGESADEAGYGRALVNDLGLNGYINPPTAYGGPCPPWNDARLHHYHFIVLALDKGTAQIPFTKSDDANAKREAKAMFDGLMASDHVIAKGTVIGTYTLNPKLRRAK